MSNALRTLRAVQWSMLASIVVYIVLGELLGPRVRGVDPGLSYLFSTLAVGIVGTIFVVRRTLVQRAAVNLAAHPDDSLSLGHWSTGYLITYTLCDILSCWHQGLVRSSFLLARRASVDFGLASGSRTQRKPRWFVPVSSSPLPRPPAM